MKKVVLFITILAIFIQCNSVEQYNQHYDSKIPVNDLKSDVDFTYKKLKQLHPFLYGFISKEDLDHKFDSIKNSLKTPLKPLEFYKKISPIVAAVKQGHMIVYPPMKRLSTKESKALEEKGIGPFSQIELGFNDNKLYVLKNKSTDSTIHVGSQLISVDNIKVTDIIQEHNKYFTSDGFNTTFKPTYYNTRLANYFVVDHGIKDSLLYAFKYNDSIENHLIKRYKKEESKDDSTVVVKAPKIKVDREKTKALKRKNRIQGYDATAGNYTRNIEFRGQDSSTVIIKIRGFKNRAYKKFYKESFTKIKNYKTKNLILDLRDNGGGRLSEINYLYSFLADTSYVLLEKSKVVSRSSAAIGSYLSNAPLVVQVAKTILFPFTYTISLLTTKKDKDGSFYQKIYTKEQEVDELAFKGKLYVLINGGSFSASSILSATLKGTSRATFVGEETGGNFNGTVAGIIPIIKLPHSDLKIRMGLMHVIPHQQTTVEGHGIYPDKEIEMTMDDVINQKDPQLEWIFEDIKSNNE